MAERKRNKEIHFYVEEPHYPAIYSTDILEEFHIAFAHIQRFLLYSPTVQLLFLLISCSQSYHISDFPTTAQILLQFSLFPDFN